MGKPYQFFLCHHKAGAGNFVRLLKMSLQEHPSVSRGVFVDSDDLEDLTALFGYVQQDVDVLVMVGSKEILKRPWCAGELATCHVNKVPMVAILLPDFAWPDPEFIDSYDTHVADIMSLTKYW